MTVIQQAPARVRARGEHLVDRVGELGTFLIFCYRVLYHSVVDIIVRQHFRRVVFKQVSDIVIGVGAYVVGAGMVFVIIGMSFFVGSEVGLQGFRGLETIGAQSFTGLVGSFANVREITPVIAAVALAAQVGAGFTAEIGAMRISEEIDALEVMSIPSLVYLVCTRVVAIVIALLPLYLVALFSSFFATRLVTTRLLGLSPGIYDYYFHLYLPPIDILYSVLKVITFAVIITLIHCYYGFTATGGPAGVGFAVGRAIRLSIITIVITNLLLSFLFWGHNVTVSLTG